MKHEAGVVFSTEESKGQNMNPIFNYKHTHHVEMVTDYILDYFDQGNVSNFVFNHFRFNSRSTPTLNSAWARTSIELRTIREKAPSQNKPKKSKSSSLTLALRQRPLKTVHQLRETQMLLMARVCLLLKLLAVVSFDSRATKIFCLGTNT